MPQVSQSFHKLLLRPFHAVKSMLSPAFAVVSSYFSLASFSTNSLHLSRPYSIFSIILLWWRSNFTYALQCFCKCVSCCCYRCWNSLDCISHRAIHFIIGSLFEYCWFLNKSSAFIYLHKPGPISMTMQKWVRGSSLTHYCFTLLALLMSVIFTGAFGSTILNTILTTCVGTSGSKVSSSHLLSVQVLKILLYAGFIPSMRTYLRKSSIFDVLTVCVRRQVLTKSSPQTAFFNEQCVAGPKSAI